MPDAEALPGKAYTYAASATDPEGDLIRLFYFA